MKVILATFIKGNNKQPQKGTVQRFYLVWPHLGPFSGRNRFPGRGGPDQAEPQLSLSQSPEIVKSWYVNTKHHSANSHRGTRPLTVTGRMYNSTKVHNTKHHSANSHRGTRPLTVTGRMYTLPRSITPNTTQQTATEEPDHLQLVAVCILYQGPYTTSRSKLHDF